jgi:hypothetical protein
MSFEISYEWLGMVMEESYEIQEMVLFEGLGVGHDHFNHHILGIKLQLRLFDGKRSIR